MFQIKHAQLTLRRAAVVLLSLLTFVSPIAAQSRNANDGSRRPPRLVLVQAMWGMNGLPTKEIEWTLEEKLLLIKAAGFDAVDIGVPSTADAEKQWALLLTKHKLELGLQTHPTKFEDLIAPLAVANRMQPLYLDVHPGTYFVPEQEAIQMLRRMCEQAQKSDVPLLIQTHRGRVTQDLLRTVAYTRAVPDLRLFLDLSHYFVAGELGGNLSPEAVGAFNELMQHTSALDGRVSNGEQVQVDIGINGETNHAKTFAGLWKQTMIRWLKNARPGDQFIFRVELGPPGYSIVDLNGQEISNRWEQAKVMHRLAINLWNEAVRETKRGELHAPSNLLYVPTYE